MWNEHEACSLQIKLHLQRQAIEWTGPAPVHWPLPWASRGTGSGSPVNFNAPNLPARRRRTSWAGSGQFQPCPGRNRQSVIEFGAFESYPFLCGLNSFCTCKRALAFLLLKQSISPAYEPSTNADRRCRVWVVTPTVRHSLQEESPLSQLAPILSTPTRHPSVNRYIPRIPYLLTFYNSQRSFIKNFISKLFF